MNASPDQQPLESRSSIRMDARLDAITRQKVDDLARHFRKPRAAVLCHIMHWGLSHWQAEMLNGGESEGPVRHLSLYVDTALHARVEQTASAAGMNMAPWLRSMVRQITLTDFPASWQEATSEERSHDSRYYGQRFMLRLDETTAQKLQHLVEQFAKPQAEIIRQLIAQATPEDFPESWQIAVAERGRQSS